MADDLIASLRRRPRVPFPSAPADLAWPGARWPAGEVPAGVGLASLVERAFSDDEPIGRTYALVVVHRGRLVAERYGGALEHFDRPPDPVGPETPLLSWSIAKSVLHSAIGLLVAEGALSLDGPAPVPAWADPADPRHAISVEDLLEMRDGLRFAEDYDDLGRSDVAEMLFGGGRDDVAAFAESRPARHAPGEVFSYSSGTTNVLAGIVRRIVGPGEATRQFLRERLFDPIGASSMAPRFDEAGTFVASSFLYATARDYARFGLLQLRGGRVGDRQVLPEEWVDHGRLPRSVDPEDGTVHGAHWWVVGDRWGTFRAAGYEGQAIVISPGLDLVVVRLGKTPAERSEAFVAWREEVVEAFAAAGSVG